MFVGRDAELGVLSAAMRSARASIPRIVWIEGEPGIGKTAFIRRFLRSVDDVVVLEASGEESESTLDYGVVAQLLTRAPPASDSTALAEQISRRSPLSSFAVGADLVATLGAAQDSAPVIVVLDDAQWLDASSAAALLFALRRLHGDRVLVVIASRPDGLVALGPSWTRLLEDPDRVQRLTLPGLSGVEVNELADFLGVGPLTLTAGERLRAHTSGHPLHVRALLSELPPERLNFGDGELPAPRSFAATVLARLTRVSPDAQDLVAAAAVAGERTPLAFVAAVAGVDDPVAGLEEALAADLLAILPGRVPEEVACAHPLIRAAVYDDVSPSRRRALHLACAELSTGAASLAHRVAASHGLDDDLAAELRSSGEIEVAAGHLTLGVERLLWASRIAATPANRDQALQRAVECLVLAGDVADAGSRLDELLACADSPRRSFTIGLLTAAMGHLAQAAAAFREVIDRADCAEDPDLQGRVIAGLAIVCALRGNGDEAIAWARRALAIPGIALTAATTSRQALGLGLLLTGRGDAAIAELGFLSAARLEPEPFEAELMTARANFKTWWGDLSGAAEDLAAVIRWSRAGEPFRGLAHAYSGLAEVEYRLGRWDDGLTHSDVAVSLVQDTDHGWDAARVHAVASYLHSVRGDWTIATGHVHAARRAAEINPSPLSVYLAGAAAAHFAWVRGEWEAVLEALAPLQVLRSGAGTATGLGQRFVLAMAAEAMLSTGRPDEADPLLDRMQRQIDPTLHDPTRIALWRLRGLLGQGRRRPAEARSAFEQGRQVASAMVAPLDAALLELAHGQFLRRSGSRRAAIATLRVAAAGLEQLGARPFVVRCEVELTACGVRGSDHAGENRYGLTPREDVVARLVAAGKSNREVAAELYLSTKAIEYHLGNVFAKVNIRSRHELAGRLATSVSERA